MAKTRTKRPAPPADSPAGPLESAALRLAQALQRAERVLAAEPKSKGKAANYDLFREENLQLKEEKEKLARALDDMKQRYGQLKLATSKVAERLDAAIERMDLIPH